MKSIINILLFYMCLLSFIINSTIIKTEKFTLQNNLTVYIRQDKLTQNIGAALLVEAGSSHEPVNFPGLAHLLEHLLFLSSKKYPKEDYFRELISQNEGNSNAFTNDLITLYYFELSKDKNESFDLILDVFSRFFIDPNINDELVKREIQAVHNEYQNNLINNDCFFMETIRTLSNINSPFNHFNTGNKNTLPLIDSNKISLTKHLKDFFNNFYISNNMKLIIYTDQNFNTIKKSIKAKFEFIQMKSKIQFPLHMLKYPIAFPNKSLGKMIFYKPIGNLKMVSIVFPIQELNILNNYKAERTLDFIKNVLNKKTKNSLFYFLMKKKFAHSFETIILERFFNLKLFIIKFQLTKKGERNIEIILNCVFQAIKSLIKLKINKEFLKKFSLTNMINSMYPESTDFHDEQLINFLLKVREGRSYKKKDIEKEMIYFDIDKIIFKKILKNFIFSKSLILLASDQYEAKFENKFKFKLKKINSYMSEKYLNLFHYISKIHYKIENMSLKLKNIIKNKILFNFDFSDQKKYQPFKFKLESSCSFKKITYLPQLIKKTKFLEIDPMDNYNKILANLNNKNINKVKLLNSRLFSLKCLKKESQSKLNLIHSNERIKLWFKSDFSYLVPKAYVRICLNPIKIANSPFSYLIRSIFLVIFEDKYSIFLTQLRDAGYEITFDISSNGIDIIIYGFSQNIEKYLIKLIKRIRNSVFSKFNFLEVKKQIFREIENQELSAKRFILKQYFDKIINKQGFLSEELISSLNLIQYNDYKEYFNILLKESIITILFYGNLKQKNTLFVFKNLQKIFPLQNKRLRLIRFFFDNKESPLKLNEEINKESIINKLSKNHLDINNGILNIYQIKKTKNYKYAINYIYSKLNSAAFNWLRTKKQLGYVIQSKIFSNENNTGIYILVQGAKKNPQEMDIEIELFLKNFLNDFNNTSSNFYKTNNIYKIRQKISLEEKGISIWRIIINKYNKNSKKLNRNINYDIYQKANHQKNKTINIIEFAKKLFDVKERNKISIRLLNNYNKN